MGNIREILMLHFMLFMPIDSYLEHSTHCLTLYLCDKAILRNILLETVHDTLLSIFFIDLYFLFLNSHFLFIFHYFF